MKVDLFEMERYQSKYWHLVDFDLSESGVLPMSLRELLGPEADAEAFLANELGYPLSEGSEEARANIAAWYQGAGMENATMMNGGSEANFLTLWSLLRPGDRIAFMVPNYLQGIGLGRAFARRVDTFKLKEHDGRWALDLESLERAVSKRTRVVMVCNPNNPTGAVLDDAEMEAVVEVAERAGAWIVADEIYRGAELVGEATTGTFWGRSEKVVVTSGLSKAFAMPGLRVGWAVAPPKVVDRIQRHHDYTTLSPGVIHDRLAALAMTPTVRENILRRTKAIIRANWPALSAWIGSHPELSAIPPVAGAIVYAKYSWPIASDELTERVRKEQSVLLVPGTMFGLKRGLRFGFGFDVDFTLSGLARVDEVLASLPAG